jgi:hypothetical protein
MTGARPTAHQRRIVEAAAYVCGRSFNAYLDGKPLRSTTHARLVAALLALGMTQFLRPEDGGSGETAP